MRIRILGFIGLLFWPLGAFAQSANPLCAPDRPIVYPPSGSIPIARAWKQDEIAAGRVATECLQWLPGNFKLSVALAGSFHYSGTFDGLLARFGAISTMQGVQYWSIHDRRWQTLITQAVALRKPGSSPRADFTLEEMKGGQDFYFQQTDNRTPEPVTYLMHIETKNSDKIVIRAMNISTVHFLMLPVFKPGTLQSVYVLKRLSPETWSYFNLLGLKSTPIIMGGNQENSFINRALALFRHFAGIPTDQNPPLMR